MAGSASQLPPISGLKAGKQWPWLHPPPKEHSERGSWLLAVGQQS